MNQIDYYFNCKDCGIEHKYPPVSDTCGCGNKFEKTLPVKVKAHDITLEPMEKEVFNDSDLWFIFQIAGGVCIGIAMYRLCAAIGNLITYLIIWLLSPLFS